MVCLRSWSALKVWLAICLVILNCGIYVPQMQAQGGTYTPIISGATLPAACNPGGLFQLTAIQGTAATGVYYCYAANKWSRFISECVVNGALFIGGNCAALWGNGDIGAQANNAYAGVCALQSGCTIAVTPQANGSCYSYTTPIVFATIGEEVSLTSLVPNSVTTGNVPGGACLNFTTTAGTQATAGTGAEATNTVTLTFGAVPSGLAVNNIVNVTGCNVGGYNGFWRALTVTATTFTYSNPTASLGAATGCVATIAVAGITFDWTPVAGGGYETGAGISNLLITNTTTYTNGGGGNSTVGVRIGNTNSGAHSADFSHIKLSGWGIGFYNDNSISWGQTFNSSSLAWNTIGMWVGSGLENLYFSGGRIATNGYGIMSNNAEVSFSGVSFDTNTIAAVDAINAPGATPLQFYDCHFEDLGGTNNHYIIGAGNIQLYGGDALDDQSSGTGDYMFDSQGGVFEAYGTQINSNRVFTQVLRVNAGSVTRFWLQFFNQAPSVLTTIVGGTGCTSCGTDLTMNGPAVNNPKQMSFEAPMLWRGIQSFNLNADKLGAVSNVTASAAINTTDTVVVKTAALPANRILAGSTIRIRIAGTCTSTVGNVSTFTIRWGTAGTTADATVAAIASSAAATTGTNAGFVALITLVVRTVGASATSYAIMDLESDANTGIVATQNVKVVTGTAFNTTTANAILSVSYKTAATTTTSTIQQAYIEFVYE